MITYECFLNKCLCEFIFFHLVTSVLFPSVISATPKFEIDVGKCYINSSITLFSVAVVRNSVIAILICHCFSYHYQQSLRNQSFSMHICRHFSLSHNFHSKLERRSIGAESCAISSFILSPLMLFTIFRECVFFCVIYRRSLTLITSTPRLQEELGHNPLLNSHEGFVADSLANSFYCLTFTPRLKECWLIMF